MTILDAIEGTSALYTAQLVDEEGVGLDGRLLDTLTLSLTDKLTGAPINGRDTQNVLGTNGVSVSALGEVRWVLSPDDLPILGQGTVEDHFAEFGWTWSAGRTGRHKITIRVRKP